MRYRATNLILMLIFFVGSLPLITHGQRNTQPPTQGGRRLTLSTKRVNHPDGRTTDSLTGRLQKGDRTLNLSAFTVKKGLRARRGGPRSQNAAANGVFSKVSMTNTLTRSVATQQENPEMVQDPYDPGYNYYYAYSGMSRPDGTVVAQAVYEYQASGSQNNLYLTLGGVTLSCNLLTGEAAPMSEADQQQLEIWGASEDADLVRSASLAIIEEGPQQSPSQLLLNYYAIALFVDGVGITASGPRLDGSRTNSLHHAVSKMRTPVEAVQTSCSEGMIAPLRAVGTSIDVTTAPAVSSRVAVQCFGCCGPGCYCIRDSIGAPMYSPACANHDACVGQYGSHFARQCTGKLIVAVLYVWWRS